MNDPESFAQTSGCCEVEVAAALDKYQHLFKWRTQGKDSAMDAGCGPGTMMANIFYPLLKDKCSKIFAVDISESMLDYCRQQHASLTKVEFRKLDLENTGDIQQFINQNGQVDHVLLSFVAHWFVDEDIGWRNIFNLLCPGGDFLTVHLHSNVTHLMHEHLEVSEKWGGYFVDLHRHTPRSTRENHTEQDLHETLARAGFTNTVVELKRKKPVTKSEVLVTLIKSVHVQMDNIPVHLQDEFMKDYVRLALEKNLLRVSDNGDGYEYDFNVYVAYGQRPE